MQNLSDENEFVVVRENEPLVSHKTCFDTGKKQLGNGLLPHWAGGGGIGHFKH